MNYLSLFPSASRSRPRFMELAAAVFSQVDDLLTLIPELESGFSVAEASGAQLDARGEGFGLPRPPGLSDADYRNYLRMKLLLFSWDGTNGSVPELTERLLPGSAVVDLGDGSVRLDGCEGLPFPARDVMPVPAGVSVRDS